MGKVTSIKALNVGKREIRQRLACSKVSEHPFALLSLWPILREGRCVRQATELWSRWVERERRTRVLTQCRKTNREMILGTVPEPRRLVGLQKVLKSMDPTIESGYNLWFRVECETILSTGQHSTNGGR